MQVNLKHLLQNSAASLGISINEGHLLSFAAYFDLVHFWNKKINLFASTSPEDFVIKHLLDSLAPAIFAPLHGSKIIDIGSGAGLPAIPLAIVTSPQSVTMVEATRKKASFLRQAVNELKLDNVEIINRYLDVEDVRINAAVKYDIMTSRAMIDLHGLLKIARYHLRNGGVLVAMKGLNVATELEVAQDLAPSYSMAFLTEHRYVLPWLNQSRSLCLFRRGSE
ncbi:MAG: 16S rRNA (guanine(527)-N(7))-methyltransferase RsmG [Deltaproteobacteria bacterium]|nr:16S rRNA (guanine(527)-N(7))-methyltransferase RsmG [Deltaproteobacteria bacterium]